MSGSVLRILASSEVFRFRRQQSELQLPAALHRLEIEAPVLITLALRDGELLLELIESIDDLGDVDHENFS